MPTYEYACSSCDATHEVQQKMTDPTLTECPVCGKPTVRKLFSGVGIHFKGSGFYRNDSRDAKTTATAKDKGGSSDTSSSGKSDKTSSGSGSSDKSSSGSSSGSSNKSSSGSSSGSSNKSSSGSSSSGSGSATNT